MKERIYELIKGWARVSTWYTGHPLDEKRFYFAIKDIISELGANVNIEDFKEALEQHIYSNPEVLGQPAHWNEKIDEFVVKAENIFHYEYENRSR